MTDATQPPASRSSLLYAMGKLEATVAAQGEVIKDIPSQIQALFLPQLLSVKTSVGDHETRIRALEMQRWIMAGGGSLLVLLVGWYISYSK